MTKGERIALKDAELLYAATSRCKCGAGLAYPMDHDRAMAIRAWVCSRVLKHEVEETATRPPLLSTKSDGEHDAFDWAFYKIREETSIRNEGGHTTRPAGTLARTVGSAKCPKCKHEWKSEPYNANGLGHHWFPGECPQCGYAVGAQGSYSTSDGPPIDTRFLDVVTDEAGSIVSPAHRADDPKER
jgi:ssDNA-binding Zn-finger/Zn-ribbon topoisomerase 1